MKELLISNTIEAKKVACKAIINSYHGKYATQQEMKEYANCVNLLFPDDFTEVQKLLIKAIIVVAIIGAIAGIREGEGWMEKIILSFAFSICGVFVATVIFLLAYGVFYIFMG